MSVLHLSGEPAATYIQERWARVCTSSRRTRTGGNAFPPVDRAGPLRGVRFLYEGTVMDGAPVFNLSPDAAGDTHPFLRGFSTAPQLHSHPDGARHIV